MKHSLHEHVGASGPSLCCTFVCVCVCVCVCVYVCRGQKDEHFLLDIFASGWEHESSRQALCLQAFLVESSFLQRGGDDAANTGLTEGNLGRGRRIAADSNAQAWRVRPTYCGMPKHTLAAMSYVLSHLPQP